MGNAALTATIREKALDLGYVACGVTTLAAFPEFQAELDRRSGYSRFTDGGLCGECGNAKEREEARCVISLVDSYAEIDFPAELTPYIARAYLSRLYGGVEPGTNAPKHALFRNFLHERGIRTFDARGFIQVPDRAVAARAGVVTYGRNNFAYCAEHGSFVIVTNIIADADLVTEEHDAQRPCPPDCHACIDACPTHAMDNDGRLDPRRCVLYNNMFPSAMLDSGVRELLETHIHGCDACQLACPRNAAALAKDGKRKDPLLEEIAPLFSLEGILLGGEERFAATEGRIISPYFKDYARHRRNAAIAMGNSNNPAYIPALTQAASQDLEEEVRDASLWALRKLQDLAAKRDCNLGG